MIFYEEKRRKEGYYEQNIHLWITIPTTGRLV